MTLKKLCSTNVVVTFLALRKTEAMSTLHLFPGAKLEQCQLPIRSPTLRWSNVGFPFAAGPIGGRMSLCHLPNSILSSIT